MEVQSQLFIIEIHVDSVFTKGISGIILKMKILHSASQ